MLPSLIIEAVTPIPAALIASRIPLSVLLVESMVMDLLAMPLEVNVVPASYLELVLVPDIVPKSKVTVEEPEPIAAVELGCPLLTNCCD